MALQSQINRLRLTDGNQYALLRIRRQDLERLEKHVFRRYPHWEWGTFFQFGYRRTSWGIALSYVDGFWPGSGDLDRQVGLTRFQDQYSLRAFHQAADSSLAMGVVHSHPEGYRTWPSALDDDMDNYFGREFSAFGKGIPYCSLIIQRSSAGLTFTGRVFDRGEWLPVKTLIIVGNHIDKIQTEADEIASIEPDSEPDTLESPQARLAAVLGQRSLQRFNNATVGIIGCSGTGSPVIHVLARAGIGNFILVDPERFAISNLERMHGTSWQHTTQEPAYKVELMKQMIESINPKAKVTAFVGNILHENVVDELLKCDVLLGCTDTQHGRAALSDLAQHYLLPSIDLGVLMEGKDSRVTSQLAEVTIYSPDLPCAFCNGRIDGIEMSYELMTEGELLARQLDAAQAIERGADPDQYWRDRPHQLHTVGYLTTMIGALGAGYVEGWLTGTFSSPHSWFQFDIGAERLGVVAPPRNQMNGCTCGRYLGWSDQAKAYRNVARPQHWPRRAILLARTSS
jgi:hypothetical protein